MKRALVLLADGTEEIEVVTIVDLLRRAQVEVVVAGLSKEPVTASRGVRLVPDAALSTQDLSTFDALILPGGGPGTERFKESELVLELVRRAATSDLILGAICAAPSVLALAGVLTGKRVTSFPGALDSENASYTYLEDKVVEDGKLITSRGPGTAFDFSLTLIERLCGSEVRQRVDASLMR